MRCPAKRGEGRQSPTGSPRMGPAGYLGYRLTETDPPVWPWGVDSDLERAGRADLDEARALIVPRVVLGGLGALALGDERERALKGGRLAAGRYRERPGRVAVGHKAQLVRAGRRVDDLHVRPAVGVHRGVSERGVERRGRPAVPLVDRDGKGVQADAGGD